MPSFLSATVVCIDKVYKPSQYWLIGLGSPFGIETFLISPVREI
jgi:hypothetical protein